MSDSGIAAELALLDDLGFGGVEVQPFAFGLRREEAAAPSVRTVGTVPFIARLDYAVAEARRRGMRADLTMSSGWGLGGLLDCSNCGTHQLLMSELDVQGPADIDVVVPRPTSTPYDTHPAARGLGLAGEFDANLQLVAVVMGRLQESGTSPATGPAKIRELTDVTKLVRDGRLRVAVPPGRSRVFAIFRNLTNTRLAGAAYPGDRERFRTVDHLDGRGLAAFDRGYFEPISMALRATPDHYFVDSFEFLADLPWTPSFREARRAMRRCDA